VSLADTPCPEDKNHWLWHCVSNLVFLLALHATDLVQYPL
jgi:hypothetical protein